MKGHLYSCLEGFKSDEGVFFFIDCTQCFTNVQRYKSTSYLNGYEQYLMIFFFFEYFSWKCKIKLPARAKRSQALYT